MPNNLQNVKNNSTYIQFFCVNFTAKLIKNLICSYVIKRFINPKLQQEMLQMTEKC